MLVSVLPISGKALGVTIVGLDLPSLSTAKSDTKLALGEYIRNRGPRIPGVTSLPRVDSATNASVASIVDTIVSAHGGTVLSVSLTVEGTPVSRYAATGGLTNGELLALDGDPAYA